MKGNHNSSALGAKTARACDSCLRVRARWFCAADDAFLCHGCDNLVHSANQLASRHERVRLQTSSSSSSKKVTTTATTTTQAWHSGFTRKARTPRSNNKQFLLQQAKEDEEEQEQEVFFNSNNSVLLLPLVPEIGSEELLFDDETEDNMLCRVPVFDPFGSELCSVYNEVKDEILLETNNNMKKNDDGDEDEEELEKFSELLPSDMDLAEFAADVESLLELDDDPVNAKGSSEMVPCKEEVLLEDDYELDAILGGATKGAMVVKVKDEDQLLYDYDDDDKMACNLESILDMNNNSESFDWNINIYSESIVVATQEQEEEQKVSMVENGGDGSKVGTYNYKKERLLRLNYEEVIAAWDSHGCSPWTTGTPPKFSTDDCWQDYLGSSGADLQYSYGGVRSLRGNIIGLGSVDEGREARVLRYREKRRTRLFAKKIRYEVRKLNAEKRPRMKGRFVKSTSFVGDTTFPPQLPLKSK